MFPLFNRFHAVQTADTPTRQLFARLSEQRLDVILAEKAYVATVSHNALPKACVRGSFSGLSTSLLSLVLSTPTTTAAIIQNPDALVLTCVDKSSVQLEITVPVQLTPSADLLDELHHSLITAVASLEACLLGEHEHTDPTHDIHGLQAMHAIPMHDKEPVNGVLSFRRMCAASMSLLAARAFATAQLASKCRAERLQQKQAIIEQMKQSKKRERERAEQARSRKVQKKRERSVFVEYKPAHDIEQETDKQGANHSQVHVSENKQIGKHNEPEQQAKATEILRTYSEKSPSLKEGREPNQGQKHVAGSTAANRTTEPSSSIPKRKKRKKTMKLV